MITVIKENDVAIVIPEPGCWQEGKAEGVARLWKKLYLPGPSL